MKKATKRAKAEQSGKLKIGDDWNAITIIALSQSNPLKAVAEFVENSIDARARNITITRGKEKGKPYLRICDDGEGIRRNGEGAPDFQYVATHICDSIKRQLKAKGVKGVQGEYGIGLLSFWTVGEELTLTSSGEDGQTYRMHMKKGHPDFTITRKPRLIREPGTEVFIKPILSGIKQFSGEKIQWYLASELRDRIRSSGVEIRVIDRTARAEFKVEPREFEGRILHDLQRALPPQSDIYLEIYLDCHTPDHGVSLFRRGTRVLDSLAELDPFKRAPWTSGYLQGIVDAPFLQLTPGTRLGVIQDEAFGAFAEQLRPVEEKLTEVIEAQRKAEEEQASREVLKTIQKALKEALLVLPAEEYDWFNIHGGEGKPRPTDAKKRPDSEDELKPIDLTEETSAQRQTDEEQPAQKQFFEYAGPLYSAKISPASSVVRVRESKKFGAIARDRSRHRVENDLSFKWSIAEGKGLLENTEGEFVTFHAPSEPELVRLKLTVRQGEIASDAEALVTVTDSILLQTTDREPSSQGIPGYTFQKAPGALWRSRFDAEQNVVVINNGHRDFVYASGTKALKLRYVCRLFAKELVLKNFMGIAPEQLLERLIELTLYTENNLR